MKALILGILAGFALAFGFGAADVPDVAAQPEVRAAPSQPSRVPAGATVKPGPTPGTVRVTGGAPPTGTRPAADATVTTTSPHGDTVQSNGKLMAILFWIFAAACVGGSLFVITRANLITAVMGMVGTFLAIAAVYMMLYASFLSVVQVLVYAGAIMVLFVFVIMILNRPEDEPFAQTGRVGKGLAALGMLYLLAKLVFMLWKVTPPVPEIAKQAPALVDVGAPDKLGVHQPDMVEWGSTKAVGSSLFGDYLFPFEAISILLLIAVVGAIAVARPLDPKVENPGDVPEPNPSGSH